MATEVSHARHDQAIDHRVEATMTSNTEAPAVPVPFAERADTTVPAGAGFTLTTPATLSADIDVRIEEPPIAPTAFWKTCWQDAALHTRLHDALATLTDTTYQAAYETLVDTWGVTAPASSPAPTYAAALLDSLQRPSADRWFESLRVTRQLGGSTPLGPTERNDIINGPIALFAGSGVTPRLAIHLSHDFFEYKRIQRVRLLTFLVELSRGMDIRLVCHGRLAPKKLLHFHAADLPTSVVTDAPHPYRDSAKQAADSPQAVADAAFAALGGDHPAIAVLDHLAARSNERQAYPVLKAAAAFDVSAAAVGARVRTLIDHRLVSKDRLNTTNVIQLLPAGTALLDRRDHERAIHDAQTELPVFSGADPDASGTATAATGELTDPPNGSHGTVCATARTGERETDQTAPTEADRPPRDDSDATIATGTDAVGASGEWLSIPQQTAIQSAVGTGEEALDIALADESIPEREDCEHCGAYHVGFDEDRHQIIVSLQPSPVAARTMVRVCAALLDPRLRHSLLTPEQLDGPDGEDLGALLDTTIDTRVVRKIRNLGYLPDQATSGERYVEQLVTALAELFADANEIGDGDDFDPALAQSVCERAHGLAGTVTHIYDLLGWEVIRELTFPDYSRHFHQHRAVYLQTLATQLAITATYGHYPMYRILYEDDEETRLNTLGQPTVDDLDPVGDCLGAWVLRGRGIDRLASDLTDLAAAPNLELQADAEHFVAFFLDLSIGQATRKTSMQTIVEQLCEVKQLAATRPATAMCYAFTGSVYRTARALSSIAASGTHAHRPITLDEVRFAVGTLDPAAVLPDLETDTDGAAQNPGRSRLVHGLLTASEPLSTRELAAHAGISTATIRAHRNALAAIGLLEIDDRGPGKATYYRLQLPFREERGDAEASRPTHLVDQDGERHARSLREIVCDLLRAGDRFDTTFADDTINEDVRGWPPPLAPAVERWPWGRAWIDVIARLLGGEGGGSLRGPTPWIEGPYELSSQFGADPAPTQTRLTA